MTWLEVLQVRATNVPLGEVAKEIGYSKSTVSRVLSGRYNGNIEAIKNAVLEAYKTNVVGCPLLGEIERTVCEQYQGRPFAATNPLRIQLHHACKACPNQGGRNDLC